MNGRNSMMGQQSPPQIMAIQQVVACYMTMLPIVASAVLNDKEAIFDEAPGVIADQTWKITLEAMKRIGIKVPELPTEQ